MEEEEEIVEIKNVEVEPIKVIDTASKEIKLTPETTETTTVKVVEIKPSEEEAKDALEFVGEVIGEASKPIKPVEVPGGLVEEAAYDIDGFFSLEIDSKIIDAYVPPDPSKIASVLHKVRSKPPKVRTAGTVAHHDDFSEHKKDCTRLICSLCKKVGEYNTKELLASNRKLNKLICAAC